MARYKLVTYAAGEGPRAGMVIGEQVHDAAKLTGHAADQSVLGMLQNWAAARERLDGIAFTRLINWRPED